MVVEKEPIAINRLTGTPFGKEPDIQKPDNKDSNNRKVDKIPIDWDEVERQQAIPIPPGAFLGEY